MNPRPNKPDAANPAIASQLRAGGHWRRVADPVRSAAWSVMPETHQLLKSVGRAVIRGLMAACLTLSVAILWGEARGQIIQDVMHGLPLDAALICGLMLLVASLLCLRRFGRLAVYALAVSIWTLCVWFFLPSV
jgi:hypothetical protein